MFRWQSNRKETSCKRRRGREGTSGSKSYSDGVHEAMADTAEVMKVLASYLSLFPSSAAGSWSSFSATPPTAHSELGSVEIDLIHKTRKRGYP